ncbi:MAG TPA: GFA family protein [Caulobacterales bacterium]|nr:GFA family protein [Caulobacterales bacterium]
MSRYFGSCHCGAVRFSIEADIKETTSCDCSLCAKKNAVMIAVPADALAIARGEDNLTLYQWNTKIARHYFCKTCGIYTFHRKRSMPDHFGVNIFCLDGFQRDAVPHRLADGKDMTLTESALNPDWPGPRVES